MPCTPSRFAATKAESWRQLSLFTQLGSAAAIIRSRISQYRKFILPSPLSTELKYSTSAIRLCVQIMILIYPRTNTVSTSTSSKPAWLSNSSRRFSDFLMWLWLCLPPVVLDLSCCSVVRECMAGRGSENLSRKKFDFALNLRHWVFWVTFIPWSRFRRIGTMAWNMALSLYLKWL